MSTPAWIPLEGTANARDIGGLPLVGGGVTASKVLLRSDNLQDLTPGDIAVLEALGLGAVVDLRTPQETAVEGPTALAHLPHTRASLVADPADGVLPDRSEERQRDFYIDYLDDRPESIVAALRTIAQGPGAVVVHCAAGKDRTGVTVALALEVAGVERAAIIADYLATTERIDAIIARLTASPTYGPEIEGTPRDRHLPRESSLRAVLDWLDDQGGTARWLREHGFGDEEQAALRARLRG